MSEKAMDNNALQDGLLDALHDEIDYMATLHPIQHPGLWMQAVENVKTLKMASDVILNQQLRRAAKTVIPK